MQIRGEDNRQRQHVAYVAWMACVAAVLAIVLISVPHASAHPGHDNLPPIVFVTPTPEPTGQPAPGVIEREPFTEASPETPGPLDPVEIEVDRSLLDVAPEVDVAPETGDQQARTQAPAPQPDNAAVASPAPADGPVLAFTGARHTAQSIAALWIIGCGCVLTAFGRLARRRP